MKKLAILGAGGFAREVQQLIKDINMHLDVNRCEEKIKLVGFIDENTKNHHKIIHGAPVLGNFEYLENANRNIMLALGIGCPTIKKKFVKNSLDLGFSFMTLVHPQTCVGENVKIGAGVIITAGNYLTVDITIKDYAMINLNCTIGHDVTIGQFATLSPHATISGFTVIEDGVELGSAVTTIPGKCIGAWSMIGAGTLVTKNIPKNVVAVGCPAKVIKELQNI